MRYFSYLSIVFFLIIFIYLASTNTHTTSTLYCKMSMGMAISFHGNRGFVLLLGVLALLVSNSCSDDLASLNRSSFPAGFIFGTASASYQYEGAANEGGKGPSTWDTLTHKHPEKIQDRSNGDVAVDQYHRYKEDVGIMKYMNTDAYRFSISWSRILPKGKISSGINQEGIKYYNNLINELLANGLQPFVTLFHWDLPQALQDEYSGFYSPNIIKDFQDYSELCFKEFGDRVKHWITLNEPWSYCYGLDKPYLAAHYQLLAHAAAVQIYKAKYQVSQKGLIGITLNSNWFLPYTNNNLDILAAQRALDFMFGWFMEPITRGKYPRSMQQYVGSRLPSFSKEQSKQLIGSFDFIGLNYYTSNYAAHLLHENNDNTKPNYFTDSHVNMTTERNGIPIGPRAASTWLYVYPKGIREILLYTKKTYNNPLIYITENGIDEFNDPTLSLEEALMDTFRIDYYYRHLYYVSTAIKDGANIKGYFAWSLLDNFEWGNGYTVRFGINFVDYKDNLKRHQKLSAHWFRNFLKKY
ncbi:beta-glucosidase 13 isoform X1 [Arachis hypogaea]|uniref:beta-glucosidase 13 isoform X1 n=1 Tax=Arachis hypogaea TaxID=3818 RepID=UPI000DEC7E22|nr:beta-glucosidase 13 isoform X1 [Arachis hypogaea]QHO55195.1 Beta-glucosidase [Arachis hypogaea]